MRAIALVSCFMCAAFATLQDGKKPRRDKPPTGEFHTEIPAHRGSVILGRPSRTGITLSLLSSEAADAVLLFAPEGAPLPASGLEAKLAAGEPREIALDGLAPDTRYVYEVRDAKNGKRLLPESEAGAFHTARTPGHAFTFVVQADSHLDEDCSPELYLRTLANMRADRPDFLVDLGDTFMTEKHPTRESALEQYAAQRYYLGLVGCDAPVFLVLGNHDGETLGTRGGKDGLAEWSFAQRTRLFPNPTADATAVERGGATPASSPSGSATKAVAEAARQDRYAWSWGNALFVVLDPYWTSTSNRGGREPWNTTIGTAQYEWLAATLAASKERFKFVFIHQLTGSYDAAGRGGAEAAVYHEWGGKELDGSDGFAAHRRGWAQPIHALLVAQHVDVVFHGHDHFYARQELDGVVYQLVPQPAHRNLRSHHAAEYGYVKGEFLPSSGYLRVTVSGDETRVEYVRSAPSEHSRLGVTDRAVAASYRLEAKQR
jgi:predicted phosphodiesterase